MMLSRKYSVVIKKVKAVHSCYMVTKFQNKRRVQANMLAYHSGNKGQSVYCGR